MLPAWLGITAPIIIMVTGSADLNESNTVPYHDPVMMSLEENYRYLPEYQQWLNNQSELFLLGADSSADELPMDYRVLATCFHTLIFCFGFAGNILLIFVAHRARSLQTPTYSYLVSLAYADLLVIMTAVPEAIVFHNIGKQWLLGKAGCAIFVYLNFLGINAGSLSSPWLGLTEVRADEWAPDREQCEFRLSKELYIIVFGADLFLFYLVPLVVAVVVYCKIGKILYRSLRLFRPNESALRATNRSSLDSTGSNTAISYRRSPKSSQSMLSRQQTSGAETQLAWSTRSRVQVLRMLIVIVILFAVAWLPFRGLLVYNTFVEEPWLDIWYLFFAKTLIYLNSAMNPFLYNAMSHRFRAAVHQVLCGGKSEKLLKRKPRYTPPFAWKATPSPRQSVFKKHVKAAGKLKLHSQAPILNQHLDLFHCHYVAHITADVPQA